METTFFIEFLFAFIVATMFAVMLVAGMGRTGPGPWSGLLFYGFLLFLLAWAGGVWLSPVGPSVWNVPLLPFLIAAVIGLLIFAVLVPQTGPARRREEELQHATEGEAIAGVTIGAAYWVVLILLAAAILAR